jgi:hypothetical protein
MQESTRMKKFRSPIAFAVIAASLACVSWHAMAQKVENALSGQEQITLEYVPGKYYEQRALEAVKHNDFREALEMYQKAGYWGNKIAQYDAGMLYIDGAEGVPADKVRGIVWLGIAAQRHVQYVDQALGDAYIKATPQERAEASVLFKQLIVDYGDKVTLDRATTKFNAAYQRYKGQLVGPAEYNIDVYGNFGGGGGDAGAAGPVLSQVQRVDTRPDTTTGNAGHFLNSVKDQFSDFVQTQFGVVTVGEPESISEREQRASAAPPANH